MWIKWKLYWQFSERINKYTNESMRFLPLLWKTISYSLFMLTFVISNSYMKWKRTTNTRGIRKVFRTILSATFETVRSFHYNDQTYLWKSVNFQIFISAGSLYIFAFLGSPSFIFENGGWTCTSTIGVWKNFRSAPCTSADESQNYLIPTTIDLQSVILLKEFNFILLQKLNVFISSIAACRRFFAGTARIMNW